MPNATDDDDDDDDEVLERLTRLTRGLAHDFNNLLAIISGNIQLARDRCTDRHADAHLAEAEMATALAADLIQRLRLVATDQPMQRELIAPAATILQAFAALRSAAGNGTTLTLDHDTATPLLFADPVALVSAILNLVLNARDAFANRTTGATGVATIAITVAAAAMPDQSETHAVRIAVRDHGIGMPPEVLKRAADPYFTTKSADDARGLGLATVAGFVRQCGGKLIIESRENAGTTVSLFLPAVA